MGRVFVVELEGKSYKCRFCKTHLALAQDLVSRGIHCRREGAYVLKRVVNVFVGPAKDNTNLSRTVTEIFCCCVDKWLDGNLRQLLGSTEKGCFFSNGEGLLSLKNR